MVEMAENNNADVVIYRILSVYNDTPQETKSIIDFPLSSRPTLGQGKALLCFDVPDFHVVDAIFRLSPIIDNGIRFCTDLSLREDDVFCGMLFCHVSTIITTDLPLYRYVRYSHFSSTHNRSIETQRKLITSSYLAMQYRGDHVSKYCPDAMPMERLKYMRWVCQPRAAIEAGYSLPEYLGILNEYKQLGCWPLDYKWIHVSGLDYSLKRRVKYIIKTFICNHPRLAFKVLELLNRR